MQVALDVRLAALGSIVGNGWQVILWSGQEEGIIAVLVMLANIQDQRSSSFRSGGARGQWHICYGHMLMMELVHGWGWGGSGIGTTVLAFKEPGFACSLQTRQQL
jgi:hypothetical protein